MADGPKSLFFSDKYSFLKGQRVLLTFLIGGNIFSIERDFESKNEAVLIDNNGTRHTYSDTDLRMILGTKIGKHADYSGIYNPLWFRTLMNFFIQDDLSFLGRDPKNVMKFTIGKRQSELLTYCLMLIGIDNSLIWNFDSYKVELKKHQSDQTRINKQIVEQTGMSVDEFKAECDSVNRKVLKLEQGLDNYTFEDNALDIEEKILTLNSNITDLNTEHLIISKKFSDIKESLKISVDVDIEKVTKLYSSINCEFSEFLKKGLEDVISFREQISNNRSIFLQEREKKYNKRLIAIRAQVAGLEVERSVIYKMMEEKSAFNSIKSAYINLLEEKSNLASKESYIGQLDFIENAIAGGKSEVGKIVANIVKSKESASEKLNHIKNIFLDLVENTVDTEKSDVSPYFNIEFKSHQSSPTQIKLDVPRGSSLGKGRFKILAFDLSMFISSSKSSFNFPSFLIHDGVFHGIAHKTRINFLNYINKLLNERNDLQYIITVNEDEIIFPESEDISAQLNFELTDKSILILEDAPQNMLLGKEFG